MELTFDAAIEIKDVMPVFHSGVPDWSPGSFASVQFPAKAHPGR